MTSSRMTAQIRQAGFVTEVTTPASLAKLCDSSIDLVVINYGPWAEDHPGAAAITSAVNSLFPTAKIIGHISHGLVSEMKKAAMPAGCNILVANSVASSRLAALATRVLQNATSGDDDDDAADE